MVACNRTKDQLVKDGIALQHVLNTLTEQAEHAVQQSDPTAYFLRTMNHGSSSSTQ